jgi:hypothetical protein
MDGWTASPSLDDDPVAPMSTSKRPSKYPPSAPPSGWPEPHRSIRPSEPRNRAILAGVCATLLGAMIVSAIIRSCEEADELDSVSAPE